MIWKEEDLVDVSQEIRQNSNALVMDLQKEYKLESIRIFTKLHNEQSLRVEFSCDYILWQKIDEGLFEYSQEWIEIAIYQKIKCRYIRLSNTNCSINFKCFIRKYDALCLCSRGDGFGSRMLCFLYGKYIIDQCPNFKFGFTWVSRQNKKNEVFIGSKEDIFTQEYLDKYCYEVPKYESKFFSDVRTIAELKYKQTWTYPFGDYQSSVFLGKSHFVDFSLDDFKKKCPTIFEHIDFSPIYRTLYNKSKRILNGFTAIHMRSGDVVYNILQRRMYFTWRAPMNRVSPPELVLAIATKLIESGEKVVIFSDDALLALECKKSLASDLVYVADDFIESDLDRFQKDFFELIFLSRAKLIIAPRESTFSLLGSYIGKTNIITFDEYMSAEQQYKSILSRIQFETHPLQKASTYAYLVLLAENLQCNEAVLENLKSLIKYDPNNSGGIFKYIEIALSFNKVWEAEKILSDLKTFPLIVDDILWIRANNQYEFQKYFLNYLKFASTEYPHIFQIASKIYGKAIENKIFQSHLLTLLLQKEKEQSATRQQAMIKETIKEIPTPGIYLVAKDRIHNHLAYKLGKAMILNSKSLWGYIRMPYVLSYVKESHRKEIAEYEARVAKNPSLKLPPLESYADYKEALKEQECFTYKLGKALITANSVRGGGRIFAYLAFFQEVSKLKREFKERRK